MSGKPVIDVLRMGALRVYLNKGCIKDYLRSTILVGFHILFPFPNPCHTLYLSFPFLIMTSPSPPPSSSSSPPTVPKTMRAYLRTCRGKLPTENLVLRSNVRAPQLTRPEDVLIRVSHVALNGGVILLVKLFPHFESSPWIPELEYSGTVVAVGSQVQGLTLKVGDQVCGTRDHGSLLRYNGVLSGYVLAPARLVIKKPVNADMIEAAGLLCVGITAVQCCRFVGIKRGDKVLVTGGSGGLGSMVVQMAKDIVGDSGLFVATCSGRNVEMVKRLGADEVRCLVDAEAGG